jgi:hypothetical protein
MLEKILKTLLAIIIMTLFVQKITWPVIEDSREKKAQVEAVKETLSNLGSTEQHRIKKVVETERQMIEAGFKQIDIILPEFSAARAGTFSRLESLRDQFPGEWSIQPGAKPVTEDHLTRWSVKIVYIGTFANALTIIEKIENTKKLSGIVDIQLSAQQADAVKLDVGLELLFRNSPPTQNEAFAMGGAR